MDKVNRIYSRKSEVEYSIERI